MAGDLYWSDVKLLLHCDGADSSTTFTDRSPDGRTVTAVGNAQVKTANPKYGTGAARFDGTSDDLTVATTADFAWMHKTGEIWTVEFDISCDDFSAARGIMCTTSVGGTNEAGVNIYIGTNRKVSLDVLRGITSTWVLTGEFTTALPNDSSYHHVAITWDHTLGSDNATLWIDGVNSGTLTKTASAPSSGNSSAALTIGRFPGVAPSVLGYIDNIRITRNIRRYTATFTPPTEAHPEGQAYPATSVDPTTAVGTPTAIWDQLGVASSVDPATTIPEPFAVFDHIQTASSVDPATTIPTPFASYDQFLDASSVDPATVVGTPARVTICVADSVPRTTVVSPAYYEFDQIQVASSLENDSGVGTPEALRYLPADLTQTCEASSIRPGAIGKPTAVPSITCAASSVDPATTIPTPVADALGWTLQASSVDPVSALGTPNSVSVHQASSVTGTALGEPRSVMIAHATSVDSSVVVASPTLYRPNTYEAYSVPPRVWFGTPRAIQRNNKQASSVESTAAVGTPSVRLGLKATTLGVVTQVGEPTAIRS